MLAVQHPAAVAAVTAAAQRRVPPEGASSAPASAPHSPAPRPARPSAKGFTTTAEPVFLSNLVKVISSPSAAATLAITVFFTAAATAALALPIPTLPRTQQPSIVSRLVVNAGLILQRRNAEIILGRFPKWESAGAGVCRIAPRCSYVAESQNCTTGNSFVACGHHKLLGQVAGYKRAQRAVAPLCVGFDRCSSGTARRMCGVYTAASALEVASPAREKIQIKARVLFLPTFFLACPSSDARRGAFPHPSPLTVGLRHFHDVSNRSRRRSHYEEDVLCYRRRRDCVACHYYPASAFYFSPPLVVLSFAPPRTRHSWRHSCMSPVSVCSFVTPPGICPTLVNLYPHAARVQLFLPPKSVGIVKGSPRHNPTYRNSCSRGCNFSSRGSCQCPKLFHSLTLHNCYRRTCTVVYAEFCGSASLFSAGGCKAPGNMCGGDDSSNTTALSRSLDNSDIGGGCVNRGRRRLHIPVRGNSIDRPTSSRSSSCSRRETSPCRSQRDRFLQSKAASLGVSRYWLDLENPLFSPRSSGEKKPRGLQNSCKLSTSLFALSDKMEASPLVAKGAERLAQKDVALHLEPQEQQLFDMLMQCVRDEKLGVGGWVRDKLLNRHSDDIDIAIDKMTGVEFAGALNRWLIARGLPSHTIGVVASNPEQSKHLETATCRLLGRFQVDFVHLRTETYSEGSRIPEAVMFGSPAEDASRRDFTVNALFYNLESREVEDFTGTGLQDLRRGLLRAPLPDAEATLLDDPLRILRAVRFASRFGFTLHPDLVRAAQLDKIRAALLLKVSRERVGIELKKVIPSVSLGQAGASAREGRRPSLVRPQAGASSRSVESRGTTAHTEMTRNTSDLATGSKTTSETEESNADANGDDMAYVDPERPKVDTSQALVDDKTYAKRISAAARCVCEALALLVRLRVVSCVFKLPERVFAKPMPATGEVLSKRSAHEQQKPMPWDRDLGLRDWWVCGLRCVYALTALLELYCERAPGNDVAVDTGETSRELSIAPQFGELIEHENMCFRKDFSGSHFRALMLGAFLLPTAGRFCLNGRSKREKLSTFLVVDSLKLSRKDADQVVILSEGALAFVQEIGNDTESELRRSGVTKSNIETAHQLERTEDCTSQERSRLGLVIRSIGQSWRQALLIAAALLQTEQASAQGDTVFTEDAPLHAEASNGETVDGTGAHETMLPLERARSLKRARPHPVEFLEDKGVPSEVDIEAAMRAEQTIQAARAPLREHGFAPVLRLHQKITQAGLEEAWKLQPVYDGHAVSLMLLLHKHTSIEVKDVLPNLPRGPIFKEVQEEQVRWQLANPSKTSQDCALHLKKMYKEFS